MKKPVIYTLPDRDAFYHAVADFFTQQAQQFVAAQGRFCAVLSGGNTPKPIYQLLATSPYREQIPWKDIYLFWADERYVSPDNSQSNQQMIQQALLDHVPIPAGQIFPIPFLDSPEKSAAAYEKTLQIFFANHAAKFNLILLGLGENGHTASLFPYTDVLAETTRWVRAVFIPELNMYRITLTAHLINQADTVAFLVAGTEKADILQQVMKGPINPQQLPAQLIQPDSGNLFWFVDQAANPN